MLPAARIAAALALALGCAACSSAPAQPSRDASASVAPAPTSAPRSGTAGWARSGGGTLRYGIQEPAGITPPEAADHAALLVVDALFDSLTTYDSALRVAPSAATDWSASPEATVWTFSLRPDARFHDGTPVTAGDFAYAWTRAVELDRVGYHLSDVVGHAAVRSGAADRLAGVTTPTPLTLRVQLRRPRADFAAVVAHPALGPLPHRQTVTDPAAMAERPVGNGPFRIAEAWARGRFIRVARFDGWRNLPETGRGRGPRPVPEAARDARPNVEEVLFSIADRATAYLAFQQGRLDVTVLPTGALDQAVDRYGRAPDGDRGPGVLLGDEPALYYLGMDVRRPPFDDVAARRALSQAIDRAGIAAATLEGNVRPASAAVPPALPGARDATCGACDHNPAAARAVFAERGIDAVTLWFNTNGGHEAVAEQVRDDLAAAGVDVTFEVRPFTAYLEALRAGAPEVFRFGWTVDYPTLDDALYPLFHSGGTANHGGYRDAEVDRLLERARATLDADERLALQQAAEDVALGRDQAIVPLFTYRHRLVVSERVEGFTYGPLGRPRLERVTLRERVDALE